MTPTADRMRLILENLEAAWVNLLVLSDDIGLSNDCDGRTALEAGVAFEWAYRGRISGFDSMATERSALVRRLTNGRLESGEQMLSGTTSEARRAWGQL